MPDVKYRRRGTAIVETNRGILLTAGRHGSFILPGGGAKRGESRFIAAMRELTEETGMRPYYAQIIFQHPGSFNRSFSGGLFQDHHTVCFVKASGFPRPGGGDAKRIGYWFPGCGIRVSETTRSIIERYLDWKRKADGSRAAEVFDEDEGAEDASGSD